MRYLSNTIAGAAGLMILLGALAATPDAANGQNRRTKGFVPEAALASATTPDLGACQDLQVPAGHKVAYTLYAEGFQVYRWNGSSWTFLFPDAVLFADNAGNGAVGTHYAGPTWESFSGSKVVGANALRCTPDPANIPWLRLDAAYTEGPGFFERVTFIQRVNTAGGIAPAEPGTFVGEIARVPYTTDYVFYRAQ
jgi:hypothetical protein